MNQPLSARAVLVSGASTGIGLALVKRLRKKNYRVIATAREPSLGRFADEGIVEDERTRIRALDVTNYQQQCDVVEEICAEWGCIDVLVNNAAISVSAVIEDMTSTDDHEQFEANYFGPLRLIRLVLPQMRAKRAGYIINVSSVGGMMAMPTMGAYSASKFALEGASESLWYELRPWGIHVSLIQPGFVNSVGFQNVRFTPRSQKSLDDETSPYHHYYASLQPFIARMMTRSESTPDKIARTIEKTMNQRSPKLRVPATADAWIFYYLRRALPRRLYHWVLYRGLPNIDTWVR